MRSYDPNHPKGNKYTDSELQRHRDAWHKKVAGNIGIANREEVVETDKTVYRLLISVLPWDGSIDFIRTNNFAGFSFPRSRLDDLYEFEHQCRNPAFEFMDPDLEGLRSVLLHHIDEFTKTLATETFATNNIEWSSVPTEWELDEPKRFHEVVSKLHSTAQEIVGTYGSLVRTAKRKLGILPE